MSPSLDPGLGGWPDWARELVRVLTGDYPPSGLPQMAFDAGTHYDRLARDIDVMMEMARNVALKIGDGMPEEARKQFVGAVDSLTSGRGKAHLDGFLDQLGGVRLDLEDKGRQLYEMYWQVMAALIQLLALLAWVAFLAAFGFGGLGGLQAAIMNRARVAVLAAIVQLLQRIKVLPGVFEAFEEALLAFAVQVGNMAFGNKLFKRDSLDWGSIGKDALFGFFAGAIGEVFGKVLNKGQGFLSKFGRDTPDFGGNKNSLDWEGFKREAFGNANDFVSEGFGESLGAAAMSLIFGGPGFSWATFLSAGASSVVERNLEQGAEEAARWLRSKFVDLPDTPDGVNSGPGVWPPRSANPDANADPNASRGPNRDTNRDSGTGSGSPRNTDRDNGSNGGTRRPPVLTSSPDRDGTAGGNPARSGSGSWNGNGNPSGSGNPITNTNTNTNTNTSTGPNGNGSGRPSVVATSTQDVPDLSTYQPGGETPSPAPSMPTPAPDVLRSGPGQDTWQLPNQPHQFVADPAGAPGDTTDTPGSTGALPNTNPAGTPQPSRMPEPTFEGNNPVPTLGADPVPAPGATPANTSDPATTAGPSPTPEPSVIELGDLTVELLDSETISDISSDTSSDITSDTASDFSTGTSTTEATDPTPGTPTTTQAPSSAQEIPGQRDLTVRQQDVVIGQGAIPRASAPGEDSLVLALGAAAPDLVTGTPGDIRARLSDALVAELDTAPGTGSRSLWDTVDTQAQAAVADDRTTDRMRLGETLTRQEVYAQELQAVHNTWGDDERRSLAEAMRTHTTASDATDEILPLVAGQVYGLTVSVVQPNGSTMVVGTADARPVTVARLPRATRTGKKRGKDRDRWLGAARPEESPRTARLSDEDFQAHWEQLPTDTVGFARAVDKARSLLTELGRVTDPLSSTPYSQLGGDDRALRRLAVLLFEDSDLRQNDARRDEALARALDLLDDDPAPARPETESSVEPEAVPQAAPDAVSTTGSDPDTLVEDERDERGNRGDDAGPGGRLSERSFQLRWDKLKSNSPKLAAAAAAAQSLFAEHGRVTHPLSDAPFSDLDRADRAARRLTEMLHSDPGLQADPTRREEARAWALQLLEDPLFPVPTTDSAGLSDDESDTSSIFSSVSSVSSLSSVSSDEGRQPLPTEQESPAYEERDASPTEAKPAPAREPELPAYSEGDAAPSYPARDARPERSPALAPTISKHLRTGRRRTRRLLRYEWFDVKATDRLRQEIGLRKSTDILELAETIGRIPDDLPRIAADLGLTPKALFTMARELGADPRHLSVVLGPTLREGGSVVMRDLTRLARWSFANRDNRPQEVADARRRAGWLLAVAAHHQVDWRELTDPERGLARYLDEDPLSAPVLTRADHSGLTDLVNDWRRNPRFDPRAQATPDLATPPAPDLAIPPAAEETAPSAREQAAQVARVSQQAGTIVSDLLKDRGATVPPEQRAMLVDAAAAHLFRDPADPEGARTAAARLLDEADDAAKTAARRTDPPFDPVAFDQLWESVRLQAGGEEDLDGALADARALVGPLRMLPPSFDRDTDPYIRLKSEDRVVRRVAYHLYIWPGDTEGARALAQRLVSDLPEAAPDPLRRVGGARGKTKKKPRRQATTTESENQEAGSSTGAGTTAAATSSEEPPPYEAGEPFDRARLTAENADELVGDAFDQWRAWNSGTDQAFSESREDFLAGAVPSLLLHADHLAQSHPEFVFDGAVVAFLLSHQRHPDSPYTVSPETLIALARDRGVMVAAGRSADLAKAVADHPGLIALLGVHPDLLDTLGNPDLQADVGPLLSDGDAVTRILGDRDVLRELESDRDLRSIVLRNHRAVMGLDGDIELARLVMGLDQLSLTGYLVSDVPQFAALITELDDQGPVGRAELFRVLGAVKDNLDLQYEMYDRAGGFADSNEIHRLLTDGPLLSALRTHPAQIKT
ncbi:hypothetical protein, partial [Streptomyces sp. NPDC058548]|uniref:hypothetical protein n=1 Tax=Streptomyces sp. NPDC058548 TaxID=3346545 RepID=UPI003669D3A5